MKEDLKIFLKYIFNVKEFINIIKDGIKKLFQPSSLSQLFLILPILMIILIKFNKIKVGTLTWASIVLFFVLFLYFKYVIVYKGGEHRRWYRDKQGIPSTKQLVREEFDLRENKEVRNGEENKA